MILSSRRLRWLVGILSCLFGFGQVIAQHVIPSSIPLFKGKSFSVTFSGGTGSKQDWIGIYKAGQRPGSVASTIWQYVPASSGTVRFEGLAELGLYDIHLFCCDGYSILASYRNLAVTAQSISSRLNIYKTTDSLAFEIPLVAPRDQIEIYPASVFIGDSVSPSSIPIFRKVYSDTISNAKLLLSALSPGSYRIGLRRNNNLLPGIEEFSILPAPVFPNTVRRIGLGSCSNQSAALPTMEYIANQSIDLFSYLGDNIYIDTYDTIAMKMAYENFIRNRKEYQLLRAKAPVIATWDDHDYGCCDEDADYPHKVFSQKAFLDFFEEPTESPRRARKGIYTSYSIGESGKKLQIIVLDTRYFLDNKRRNTNCGKNDYCPWAGPADVNKTMLGIEQWKWLRTQLMEPADLRMIMSSVQFSPSYNGWEGWSIFPYEQRRMQELIRETKAEHVFFVSGDIHYSEVSLLPAIESAYPIYDFTASAINQSWIPEENMHRVGNKSFGNPNIGLLDIDWENKKLRYSVVDALVRTPWSHTISFAEMEFPSTTQTSSSQSAVQMKYHRDGPYSTGKISFTRPVSGQLRLLGIDGKIWFEQRLQLQQLQDLPPIAPGIYIAVFQSIRGEKINRKIFIQ
jgi:alkaline phosphatase D